MKSYPTLKTFLRALGSENDCRGLLRRVRWPGGDCCPRCGGADVNLVFSGLTGKARTRILHRCLGCDYHFSATAGTIFHDTHLGIRDWFLAIYLMGSIEGGVQVRQLETYIGVSHETAVNMARRIRDAIQQDKNFIRRHVQLPRRFSDAIEPASPNRNRHPTLHAVVHKFATEERAREHFARIRWPNGTRCPRCKKPDIRDVQSKCRRNRHLYRCLVCKRQFSVTSGSPLHGLHHLSEWFIALYLMESSPRGIQAKQLERLLGISYRTARSLIQMFRAAGEKRKRAFESYIGYSDPAEFQRAQEALKEERRRIKEETGK